MINDTAVTPEIRKVFAFHALANEYYCDVDIADDGIMFFGKVLSNPYFRNYQPFTRMTQENVESMEKIFRDRNAEPAFHVPVGSDNIAILEANNFRPDDETVWMGADVTLAAPSPSEADASHVRMVKGPISEALLEVFEDGFIHNKGIGYHLDDYYLEALRGYTGNDNFEETHFVYEVDSQPVSVVALTLDIENKQGFFFNVVTKNDFRQKGYCRAAANAALTHARDRGMENLYLGTETASVMEKFYESLGFTGCFNTITYYKE